MAWLSFAWRGYAIVVVALALCIAVVTSGVACGSESDGSSPERIERERSDDSERSESSRNGAQDENGSEEENEEAENSPREKSSVRALMEKQTSRTGYALDLVPDVVTHVEIYALSEILTEEDLPDGMRDSVVSSHQGYLNNLGIPIGDVDTLVHAHAPGADLTIVSGGFSQGDVKSTLESLGFQNEDYEGFELWIWPSNRTQVYGHDVNAAAFLEDGRIVFGWENSLRDILNQRTDASTQGDASAVKRALDKAGQGLTVLAGDYCVARSCSAFALALSESAEDDALDLRYVGVFDSEGDAQSGQVDMQGYIDGEFDILNLDVKQEEMLVVISATASHAALEPVAVAPPAPAAPQAAPAAPAPAATIAPAAPAPMPAPTAVPPTPEATAVPTTTPTPRPTPTATPVPYWASAYSPFVLQTDSVQIWDVGEFNSGVPPVKAQELFNSVWNDPENHYVVERQRASLGRQPLNIAELILIDETDTIVTHSHLNSRYRKASAYLTIAEGSFDFKRIRQDLESEEFTPGSYRRHEVWEGGTIKYEWKSDTGRAMAETSEVYADPDITAVALIESDNLVVAAIDMHNLQQFLRAYSGSPPGLMVDAQEQGTSANYVKQTMDKVGEGWFIWGEFLNGNPLSIGLAMSNGETEHTVKITWALVYEDEEQAEYAGQRLSEVEYHFNNLVKVEDVRVDENFVIVEASVDEDDLSPLSISHYYIQ